VRFTVVAPHLRDRSVPLEVRLRFVRHAEGLEVRLGDFPVALIETLAPDRYRIRTGAWSPQLSAEFVNLHAAVCATEHLLQTGGSSEWRYWSAELDDGPDQRLLIHLR
jgi:hypothetical protein